MFQKSRILAIAALAAGTVGMCASAAYAGTITGASGDNGGLVNVSHNLVPIQGCNNQIPVNGGGVQVPLSGVAAALGLLDTEPVTATQSQNCGLAAEQANDTSSSAPSTYQMSGPGWGWSYTGPSGDNGGLVNVSHNEMPVQLCNNQIPVNALGVQVPLSQVAGALGILSTGAFTAAQASNCKLGSAQDNS